MTDRRKLLLIALDEMDEQYPDHFDDEFLECLLTSGAPESALVGALAEMVGRSLARYENDPDDDGVDTLAESAHECAVVALTEFGLMDRVNSRFGRWTPAGKQFLEEGLRDWDEEKTRISEEMRGWKGWKDRIAARINAKQRKVEARARNDRIRWAKRAINAAGITAGVLVTGWFAISSTIE
jgi:hypothetical protein